MASARVALVHAHGGWGKSTLATEAADGHPGDVVWVSLAGPVLTGADSMPRLLDALVVPELSAIARVMGRRRATLLVVDEVGPDAWAPVAELAAALPAPHRVIGLGRSTPPADLPVEAARLTTADLAFTPEEFQLLLADHVVGGIPEIMAEYLHDAVKGWGTALRAIAAALGRSVAPVELGRRLLATNVVLADLIDELLAPLDHHDREALAFAARLPHLDRRLAEQIGVGTAVRRGQELGLPWETPTGAAWRLPDPVRDILTGDDGLSDEALASAIESYAAAGRYLDACRLALDHAAPERAAAMLAAAPSEELAALHKPTVLAMIESLDPELRRRHPWLDVQVARLLTAAARYADRNEFVLASLPDHEANPAVTAALAAERFRDLAYFSASPSPDDVEEINRLLAQAELPGVRSRLEQGLALLRARAEGVAAAEDGLRRAARHAERAGERHQAMLVLRDLAWVVLLEQGRLREVIETFDQLEQLVGPDSPTTSWRINRADAHLLLGNLDAADRDLRTAARMADLHHDEQHVAYASWARATLESLRGERLRVLAAVQRAEKLAGSWLGTVTGVLFHAQCADALARVELRADADERLARARQRRDDDERAVLLAELAVEGRIGDPERALEAARRLTDDPPEVVEQPRAQLLRAYATHRAGGDATEATIQAVVAYDTAGLLHTAALWEPQACAALQPIAAAAGADLAVATPDRRAAPPDHGADLAAVLQDRFALRPREAEVVLALRTGGTNAEIAEALGVTPSTVRKHLQHAYATLDVRSRTEALVFLGNLENGRTG